MFKKELSIRLDQDGTGEEFDKVMSPGFMPADGEIVVAAKQNGTVEGNAVVAIAFRDVLHGKPRCCRTIVSGKLFIAAARSFAAAHPVEGSEDFMDGAPPMLMGKHRGIGWQAAAVDKCYLITVEGSQAISIGFSEREAKQIGPATIDMLLRASGQ